MIYTLQVEIKEFIWQARSLLKQIRWITGEKMWLLQTCDLKYLFWMISDMDGLKIIHKNCGILPNNFIELKFFQFI